MSIPTETIKGCVVRTMHGGKKRWVLVQHFQGKGRSRAAVEVKPCGGGGYVVTGTRAQWTDGMETLDELVIAEQYVKEFPLLLPAAGVAPGQG